MRATAMQTTAYNFQTHLADEPHDAMLELSAADGLAEVAADAKQRLEPALASL